LEDALERVQAGGFDLAIIDVQLKDGKQIWPVADRLAETGTPFILATGGHVDPPPHKHARGADSLQALHDRCDRAGAGAGLGGLRRFRRWMKDFGGSGCG
jgi:hypothetical protein